MMKEVLVLGLPNANPRSISELPLHHRSRQRELPQARQYEVAGWPQQDKATGMIPVRSLDLLQHTLVCLVQ